MDMEVKINTIKTWLGVGSVNIFGLPMSGKDTQGIRLAEAVGGRFLSSGMIIRAMEQETHQSLTDKGDLAPTELFAEWVLPYFARADLAEVPLVLSSVGRWVGEEDQVMATAEAAGHPIKAVILLNVSEADVIERWRAARILGHREDPNLYDDLEGLQAAQQRADDRELEVFQKRIAEFKAKTMPALENYQRMGLLIPVKGDMERGSVFAEMVEKLYNYARERGDR